MSAAIEVIARHSAAIASISNNHVSSTVSAITTVDAGSCPRST
jgi:hypothetical protein